jgi:hypothetical protein
MGLQFEAIGPNIRHYVGDVLRTFKAFELHVCLHNSCGFL